MNHSETHDGFCSKRIGYVVKRYPRYSETFIVNEILGHEAAGLSVEIFSLLPPVDTHFQDRIAKVRAPVHYLSPLCLKPSVLWTEIEDAAAAIPNLWSLLEVARGEDVRDVYQAVRLARQVVLSKIDHLHAHFATSATTVARLAARFAGVPYTFTAHAKDIFHESVRPDDLRTKLDNAAATITVSDFNLHYLHDTFGPAAARVARVYNGLILDAFPYRSPVKRPPCILSVGRLVEKKGLNDLIDACAILAARGLRFECQLIGSGELEEALRSQIESLRLHEHVQLVGPRPQSELVQLVQNASVFAAPCVVGRDGNRDGLPTVLLEAMALGTPCVSTDVTGIPEVLQDEQTGLMVPQRDPQALAIALERLLEDGELRVRLAKNARRLIESQFDIKHATAKIRSIFQSAGAPARPVASLQESI